MPQPWWAPRLRYFGKMWPRESRGSFYWATTNINLFLLTYKDLASPGLAPSVKWCQAPSQLRPKERRVYRAAVSKVRRLFDFTSSFRQFKRPSMLINWVQKAVLNWSPRLHSPCPTLPLQQGSEGWSGLLDQPEQCGELPRCCQHITRVSRETRYWPWSQGALIPTNNSII